MKIAIVDDHQEFANKIESIVKAFFESKKEKVLIGSFSSGSDLLENVSQSGGYALYLLDVEMPEMDGLALLDHLRKIDSEVKVVFLTSYDRYAVSSIKLGTYYYILKSEYQKEIPRILERFYREERERIKEYLITGGGQILRIPVKNIIYLHKESKYTVFQCNEQRFFDRIPLSEAYERLPQKQFAYIDRATLVNIEMISSVQNHMIEMANGDRFAISRRLYSDTMEKVTEYLGSR